MLNQIFIICAAERSGKPGTSDADINAATVAIKDFENRYSYVKPMQLQASVFKPVAAAGPAETLNSKLIRQIQNSIGAIVFIDSLRPNILYELGFFHGQGKPVLLLTRKETSKTNKYFSDLAGVCLGHIERDSERKIKELVFNYLNELFNVLATSPLLSMNELPTAKTNGLEEMIKNADEKFLSGKTFESEFGKSIVVNTWGGVLFRLNYNLMPSAKFKLVMRTFENATYSIYFFIEFRDESNETNGIAIGVSSNRAKVQFESNERSLPSPLLGSRWSMISYSFKDLLKLGQVLEDVEIIRLKYLRIRSGNYNVDDQKINKALEIGFLNITGINK